MTRTSFASSCDIYICDKTLTSLVNWFASSHYEVWTLESKASVLFVKQIFIYIMYISQNANTPWLTPDEKLPRESFSDACELSIYGVLAP